MVIESEDFCRADKGKIHRIKENYAITVFKVIEEVKIFIDAIVAHYRRRFKIWGFFANEYSHGYLL